MPEVPGEYKVTLKPTTQPGEIVTTNNEMSTFVTVLKGGLNVLYIEGAPARRAEVLAPLARRLARHQGRLRAARCPQAARRGRSTWPSDFKPGKYDVYILGDVDATAFTTEELAELAAAVDQGAGLIMLGGLHTFGPGGYGRHAAGRPAAGELRPAASGSTSTSRRVPTCNSRAAEDAAATPVGLRQ